MACEPALAAELWRTVAGYLEFYELTRLATTNTDLRAVCDADELWARFALSWLVGAGLAPRQAAVFRETCLPRWRDAGVRPVVRKAAINVFDAFLPFLANKVRAWGSLGSSRSISSRRRKRMTQGK